MQKKIHTKKGFSIGEVLISMFVLLVGMLGTMTLVINSVLDIGDSRDTIIAAGLAQEGIELVRNVRDNNAARRLSDEDHDLFEGFMLGSGDTICTVGFRTSGYQGDPDEELRCPGQDETLYRNTDGFYSHQSGGTRTKFERRIVFADPQDTSSPVDGEYDQVTVRSYVSWGDDGIPSHEKCNVLHQCTVAETILTSWISQ